MCNPSKKTITARIFTLIYYFLWFSEDVFILFYLQQTTKLEQVVDHLEIKQYQTKAS